MLEQGFADKACGFKFPIFPDPSPVIFSARSRMSFGWYALFCQLAAPLDLLDEPQRTAWRVKRDPKFDVRSSGFEVPKTSNFGPRTSPPRLSRQSRASRAFILQGSSMVLMYWVAGSE
jgi:hypothetical protein